MKLIPELAEEKEWEPAGLKLARSAREWIERHYAEKFSLSRLSGDLYVNGSYLLRVFKQYTGLTLLEYHNRYRCEKACEMLRFSRRPISGIAEVCGFVSPSHFSHVFRREVGMSPGQYRKQYQQSEEK